MDEEWYDDGAKKSRTIIDKSNNKDFPFLRTYEEYWDNGNIESISYDRIAGLKILERIKTDPDYNKRTKLFNRRGRELGYWSDAYDDRLRERASKARMELYKLINEKN